MKRSACRFFLIVAACTGLGCGSDDPAPRGHAVTPAAATVTVTDALRAARYAFHMQGAAWVSGDGTLVASASTGGFSVTPFHHPRTPDRQGKQGTPRRGASLRIETSALGRGVPREVPRSPPQTQSDGSLTFARGEAVEHLRVTDQGAQQSWSFASPPAGRGDLDVRVHLTGMTFRGTTPHGLHFTDPNTNLGLRYSHGTWIDAEGTRTAIPARWTGHDVLLRVPAQLLESSRFPALLDPTVSPELGLDRPTTGPAPAAQRAPSVAWDGALYLAVWEDHRHGDADVYAARVSARGDVLDPAGIVVASGPAAQRAPRVAFSADHFVVVWEDHRHGNADVYAARVTPTGVVLDRGGLAIAQGPEHQGAPAIAPSRAGTLVVWEQEHDLRTALRAVRLSSEGTVLDPTPIDLPGSSGSQRHPTVAWNGEFDLVVWEDFRGDGDVYAARVAQDGTVLDPTGLAITRAPDLQLTPTAACGVDECLVAWADLRDGQSFDVWGARVGFDGTVHDPEGAPIVQHPEAQFAPTMVWDGGRYLLAWQDARVDGIGTDLRATRFDPTDRTVSEDVPLSEAPGDQVTPALAAGNEQVLALWDDRRTGREEGDVRATRIALPQRVLDPTGRIVSTASAQERSPAVVFDGSHYLVVWESHRALGDTISWDLLGMRVSPTGRVLDPAGLPIAIDPSVDERTPTLAWNGRHHLVAWEEHSPHDLPTLRARRLEPSGRPADPTPIALTPGWRNQRAPSATATSEGWLVVWQDGRSFVGWDVYASAVTPMGAHAAPFPVSIAPNDQREPRVASDGTHHLVVWRASLGFCGFSDDCDPASDPLCEFVCDADPSRTDIHGAWIDPLLGISGPNFALTTAPGTQERPALAAGAGRFFIAWEDHHGTDTDVHGVVLPAGSSTASAELLVSGALGAQQTPSVAFGNGLFTVAWRDSRLGVGDLYAARVLPTGTVLDVSGLPVATDPTAESAPALAWSPEGSGLLAYTRFDPDTPFGSERVRARTVSFGLDVGSVCHTGNECGTGFCASGLCCPVACDDGDPCTDDGCAPGVCTHVRRETGACALDAGPPVTDTGTSTVDEGLLPGDVSIPSGDTAPTDSVGSSLDVPAATEGSPSTDASFFPEVSSAIRTDASFFPEVSSAIRTDASLVTSDGSLDDSVPMPADDVASSFPNPSSDASTDASSWGDTSSAPVDAVPALEGGSLFPTPEPEGGVVTTDAPKGSDVGTWAPHDLPGATSNEDADGSFRPDTASPAVTDVSGERDDQTPSARPGCGCSVPGDAAPPSLGLPWLLGALGLTIVRRRR
jgi:MYXO-CTERM domain-containing protein